MKIILCLTFESRFTTFEALFITPSERRKGGGLKLFGLVSPRGNLKTTLQRRRIVNG